MRRRLGSNDISTIAPNALGKGCSRMQELYVQCTAACWGLVHDKGPLVGGVDYHLQLNRIIVRMTVM